MATSYTYPGVYVEEIPSGVRTIVGVSTSDTAFIDFFKRGPVDEAIRITSYADFERTFGGLDTRSEASYAIQQFYLNGGSVAWVIRVAAGDYASAELTLQGGSPLQDTLGVTAASPGTWGTDVQVAIDHNTRDSSTFNMAVRLIETTNGRERVVATETYRNLSMDQSNSRYAVDVVNEESSLVQLTDQDIGEMPAETGSDVIGNPQDSDFVNLAGSPSDGDEPGSSAWEASGATAVTGDATAKTGMYALDNIQPYIFNILCLPVTDGFSETAMQSVITAAEEYCADKRAFLIVDIPPGTDTISGMTTWMTSNDTLRDSYAALYFPRIQIPDSLNEYRLRDVGPSGTLAGIFARTDSTRGVWKAPAGTDATLKNVSKLSVLLTDAENGGLNILGINVLRNFPIYGNISWGARTLEGSDQEASEWKYIPVRRTALYIEESLYQGLKWVVFEPNDEPLWAQIRLNAGAFMHNMFRQGAFQGTSPKEAYFVRCDRTTTTQNDIDRGIVNILVGFAPLKPAEFVVIQLQQMTGQIEV